MENPAQDVDKILLLFRVVLQEQRSLKIAGKVAEVAPSLDKAVVELFAEPKSEELSPLIKNNYLVLLDAFYTRKPFEYHHDWLKVASTKGHLDMVQWLIERFDFHTFSNSVRSALSASCANGHLSVAQLIAEHFDLFSKNVKAMGGRKLLLRCTSGHPEVVQWLAEHFCLAADNAQVSTDHSPIATRTSGHLEVAQWLVEHFGLTVDDAKSCYSKASRKSYADGMCPECGKTHNSQKDIWCDQCRGGFLRVGKHAGESFRKVFETDIDYCYWVKSANPTGNLAKFDDWLDGMLPEEESPILRVGKHKGETFEEIYENDESYCDWVLKQNVDHGLLFEFSEWLRSQNR